MQRPLIGYDIGEKILKKFDTGSTVDWTVIDKIGQYMIIGAGDIENMKYAAIFMPTGASVTGYTNDIDTLTKYILDKSDRDSHR